ncbi:acetylornithine deacetylase [Fictibacillus macauensis ZFHKF-1]|uniref:Acetylornithine deacetylase n=1 Tax=Fictibacillus macauensis ZFHKF-1 TaxID=1196324 RepID=I8AMD0_9BACL|nr:acetylornithine deacetylase [Fictibacillus macauensis ZFHKF-1]
MKDQISAWIANEKQEGIQLLQKMVQLESEQGHEERVQLLVANKLKEWGMDVDVWYPDEKEFLEHPYFCATRTDFSKSPNVATVLKGTGGGRSIVLNGHVDVVPPGDVKQWSDHPYSGDIRDGKLYGRGATDMKGGNLCLLLALKCLKELQVPLKGDVIFHSVMEEESGGAGTLAAILRGYTGDAALIPEPTNLKIFPSQQGSMWFRIHVYGRAAHGGTRYEGVSALEKATTVITALQNLEKKRNDAITDPLYEKIPIPLPINLGKIQGGEWPSSVPDHVIIEGRIGVAPTESLDDVRAELEEWIEQIEDDWLRQHPPTVEWFGAQWLPGAIPTHHELMNILSATYKHVRGSEPVVEASPWGTDGGLLTAVGHTPSLVFGPGVTSVAHYPDEYIELDAVFEATEIIIGTIIAWCE